MKLSVCTISFRHHLISLERIAHWSQQNQFDSIELWGVHAKNLRDCPEYDKDWLDAFGLSVSMVSDYLPLDGDLCSATDSAVKLCCLTCKWGSKKLRTFSGSKGSAVIDVGRRQAWTKRLRELCIIAQDYGLQLVIETHPNTLADTLPSILQLIEEVDHPAMRINFDVIHVWEMREDPIVVFNKLEPMIVHLHLKNIADRNLLDVFTPSNIYSPAGNRMGMTSIFHGAYDFKSFLSFVMARSKLHGEEIQASLEWFGPEVMPTLENDFQAIAALQESFTNR